MQIANDSRVRADITGQVKNMHPGAVSHFTGGATRTRFYRLADNKNDEDEHNVDRGKEMHKPILGRNNAV